MIARVLGEEARMEAWTEELTSHPELWFGGAPFTEFLMAHVPAEDRQKFCQHVALTPELRLDHARGRVHPARTGLRRTVEALLAEEEDPIPLTSLVELLVLTGHHPSATREVLKRHRNSWLQTEGFPAGMILWDR